MPPEPDEPPLPGRPPTPAVPVRPPAAPAEPPPPAWPPAAPASPPLPAWPVTLPPEPPAPSVPPACPPAPWPASPLPFAPARPPVAPASPGPPPRPGVPPYPPPADPPVVALPPAPGLPPLPPSSNADSPELQAARSRKQERLIQTERPRRAEFERTDSLRHGLVFGWSLGDGPRSAGAWLRAGIPTIVRSRRIVFGKRRPPDREASEHPRRRGSRDVGRRRVKFGSISLNSAADDRSDKGVRR